MAAQKGLSSWAVRLYRTTKSQTLAEGEEPCKSSTPSTIRSGTINVSPTCYALHSSNEYLREMGDKALIMPQISLHSRVPSQSDSATTQAPTDKPDEEVRLDERLPSLDADQQPAEEGANVVDETKEKINVESTEEMENLVGFCHSLQCDCN
jgi:hypothetical protein